MNALVRSQATRTTAAFDSFQLATFGGQLEKARFLVFRAKDRDPVAEQVGEIGFFLNPSTIHIDKEIELEDEAANQGTTAVRFKQTRPIHLNIGELWFDTYDSRESVRERHIDALERLLDYDPDTHVVPVLRFVWGQFSQRTRCDDAYNFVLTKLSVDYTLFLPDGTPCRAKVSLCLTQVVTPKSVNERAPKQSPDHARIYTVKKGDTLQGIARMAYDDPREWRRIANTNPGIDPMQPAPGSRLLLPPILR